MYLGFDERLEVERAIKVLSPKLAARADIRARFETEARTMAKLQHPNIVSVYDVGSDGDRVYLVMELVPTGSLIDLLDRQGAMLPREACDAVIAILLGLQAAHARGVVHRDIKPHNVLVTPDGGFKVADFGIARVSGADRSATRTGMAMGTLSYMAPEQRTNAKMVDGRADLYAVSATLFALLTNQEPFELHAVDHHDEIFAGLPRVLVDIMKRASKFRPDDRFPDAGAMIAALRDARVMLAPNEPRPVGASGGHPTLAVGGDSYLEAVIPDQATPPPVAPIAVSARGLSPLTLDPGSEVGTTGARRGETFADVDLDVPAADAPRVADRPAAQSPAPASSPSAPAQSAATLVQDPFTGGPSRSPPWLRPAVGVSVVLGIVAVAVFGWQAAQAPAGDPPAVIDVPPVVDSPTASAASAPPPPTPAVDPAPPVVDATPVAQAAPPPVVTPAPAAAPAKAPTKLPTKAPAVTADAAPSSPPAAAAPAAAMQTLSVNSLPYSNVSLDGKAVGTTGWSGSVAVGAHRVLLTTADGRTKSLELNVKETEPKRYCWDFAAGAECSR